MRKLLNAIIKSTGNMIFLLIVALVLVVTIVFVRTVGFNEVNRVYADYDKILSIQTDYENEEVHITMASTSFFNPPKETVYKLSRVLESRMIIIDNSVHIPTMIDDVLHIPDTY